MRDKKEKELASMKSKYDKEKNQRKTEIKFSTILAVLLIILISLSININGAAADNTSINDPTLKYETDELKINNNNNNIKISEQLWKKIQEQTNPGTDGKATGWNYNTNSKTLSKDGSPSIKIEAENNKEGHKGTVMFIQGNGESATFTQYVESTKGFLGIYSGQGTIGSDEVPQKTDHVEFIKGEDKIQMNKDTYQLIRSIKGGTLKQDFNDLKALLKIEGISSVKKEGDDYKTKDKSGREVILTTPSNDKIKSSTTISGSGETSVKQDITYGSEGKAKGGNVYQGTYSDNNKGFELKTENEVTSWQRILSSGKLGSLDLVQGQSLFKVEKDTIVLGSESEGFFGDKSTISIVRSDAGEKEILNDLKSESLVISHTTAEKNPKKTVFFSQEYKQWLTMEFDQKGRENPKPTAVYDQNLRPVGIVNSQGNALDSKITYDDKTGLPKIIKGNDEYDLSKEADLNKAIKEVPEAVEAIRISNIGPALEKAVSAAQGASALGNFLFKGNELIKAWKDTVDEIWKYLEPEQLVTGFFCSDYVRRNQDQGTALTFQGDQLNIIAHIEGSRSSAITYLDQSTNQYKTEYFYKITWNIKAPSDKDVNFNVRLQGQKESKLYTGFIKIEKNQNNKALGNTARVKYSPFFYDTVCIEFEGDVDWPNPLCNKITEYHGLTVEQASQQQASSTSSSSSGSSSVANNDW